MENSVLDESAWRSISCLGNSEFIKDFYMAGGTALALQIGHRKSLDLDFFQLPGKDKVNFTRIYKETRALFGEGNVDILLKQYDQIVLGLGNVKVTFLAYPFALVEPLVEGSAVSRRLAHIKLASSAEIGLMKAYTIGRRATFRDYVDLYFLLRTGQIDMKYILEKAPGKFIIEGNSVFSRKLFLEQLVYTKDIDDKDETCSMILKEKLNPEDIESFLLEKVKGVLRDFAL